MRGGPSYSLVLRCSDLVRIKLLLSLAEVLLNLPFELFLSSLDVLAVVVRRIAKIATKVALHFLRLSLDLVFHATGFQVFVHCIPLYYRNESAAICGTYRIKQASCRSSGLVLPAKGTLIDCRLRVLCARGPR